MWSSLFKLLLFYISGHHFQSNVLGVQNMQMTTVIFAGM
jgi:hypothetical protein